MRLVIPSLGNGGSERVAVRLASAWSATGHSSELITVRRGGVWSGITVPGVKVTCLEYARTVLALPALIRHLQANQCAPLIVFGFDLAVGLGLASRLGLLRTPWVYREGSMPMSNIPTRMRKFYRLAIGSAARVIAQSRAAQEELIRLGVRRDRVVTIPNPLDPVIESADTVALTKCPTSPHIVSVARLSREKGVDRLIRAYPALTQGLPGCSLTVYGEGPARASLESEALSVGLDPAAALPGFHTRIHEMLRKADVFVLPSVYEGLPNALMEAIGLGMRVIAADSGGGVRELMSGCGLARWIVPQETFDANLAAVVEQALGAPVAEWAAAARWLRAEAGTAAVARRYWDLACGTIGRKD